MRRPALFLALAGVFHASFGAPAAAAPVETIEGRAARAADQSTDERTRAFLKARFWDTTLGQMMTAFLEPAATPREAAARAHGIADRVYSRVSLRIARRSAIDFMIVDLHEQNRVEGLVRDRVQLLQSIVAAKANEMEGRAYRNLYDSMPLFALLGFVSGSPLAQARAAKLLGGAYDVTFGHVVGFGEILHVGGLIERSPLGRWVAPFFRGYETKKALGRFVAWFSVFAIVYATVHSGTTASAPFVARLGIYEFEKNIPFGEL